MNVNQGKYFYTCQKAARCGFWRWEDELVSFLNNAGIEPPSAMRDPRRTNPETTRIPHTPSQSSSAAFRFSLPTPGATVRKDGPAPSEDKEVAQDQASVRGTPSSETPRKAAKAGIFSTPRKRRREEPGRNDTDAATPSAWSPVTVLQDDDPFVSAHDTPTPIRFHDDLPSGRHSEPDLAPEILRCLSRHHVSPMMPGLKDAIDAGGERHDRGKNATIARLERDIAAWKNKFLHLELDLRLEREKAGK